jgi:hypothetical protein
LAVARAPGRYMDLQRNVHLCRELLGVVFIFLGTGHSGTLRPGTGTGTGDWALDELDLDFVLRTFLSTKYPSVHCRQPLRPPRTPDPRAAAAAAAATLARLAARGACPPPGPRSKISDINGLHLLALGAREQPWGGLGLGKTWGVQSGLTGASGCSVLARAPRCCCCCCCRRCCCRCR